LCASRSSARSEDKRPYSVLSGTKTSTFASGVLATARNAVMGCSQDDGITSVSPTSLVCAKSSSALLTPSPRSAVISASRRSTEGDRATGEAPPAFVHDRRPRRPGSTEANPLKLEQRNCHRLRERAVAAE